VPAGPAAGATSHELFGPVGVDSDAAGRQFAVDTTSRLFVIDHGGALLAMIGNQFPTLGAVEYASFAIDAGGKLTFADIGHETEARLIVSQLLAPIWPPG
jgi:hypothetical protein